MSLFTRTRLRQFGIYCYVWLMLGFFTGTLLLVGPVRWITAALRGGAYSQATEDLVMISVIVLFVLVSALLAWLVVVRLQRCQTRGPRLAIPLVLTVAAGLCLYAWSRPAVLARAAGGVTGSVSVGGGAEFVFGPYPDRRKLEELKDEGFTAVVSLQHPAVLPFEPPGIAEEIRNADDIGLEFIHAPMLPWISDNEASLNQIRTLAKEGDGRYYVHCGLGRDRANVVKRMLEREGAAVADGEGHMDARTFGDRIAEGNPPMERGLAQKLADDVYLIPFPNKHEMFGNMLSGQVEHVLLLLNRDDGQERAWLSEAEQRFREHGVPYTVEALRGGNDDHADILARKAKSLPKPLVVIVPFTAPNANTAVAETFRAAWNARGSG